MKYLSTRGRAEPIGFKKVLLSGLAPDGGLYVPETWPKFSINKIKQLKGLSYEKIAFEVMYPFIGNAFTKDDLRTLIQESYQTIHHPAKCPLVQFDTNHFLCELFHGPTLAFKDFALQLVSRMFAKILDQCDQRCVIVGATSGDTGSAAIEAFRGLEQVNVFILYPSGRVSDIQRKQMTTAKEENVQAIAIEGTFDDCQNLVKQMFGDPAFREQMNLAAINSINWARIVAQIVYYFYSSVALGSPKNKVDFVVPTGNFGDIYAGYAAKKMGLPINDLVVATNQNDILFQALHTGNYFLSDVRPSISPSMDIQVSSNFERVLFDACEKNSETIRKKMQKLREGGFSITEEELIFLRSFFQAGRSSEGETKQVIRDLYLNSGEIICPHTAVGVKVAKDLKGNSKNTTITLATAHPAKFPDAVEEACGVKPELPSTLKEKIQSKERIYQSSNSLEELKEYIRKTVQTLRSL